MTSPGRRGTVLLVAQTYPPRPSPGSARPLATAIGLRRLGYRVIVLTSGAWGSDFDGEGSEDVRRTRDLLGTRFNWRRRNMDAYEGRARQHYDAERSLVTKLLVPDVPVATWVPFALPEALKIARRAEVDVVVTTSPPESDHLIGWRLRRAGIPWVAELRDGWRFESYRSFASGIQEKLDARMEAAVLDRADAFVAVSEPISRDAQRRFGAPATTIPTGFDPGRRVAPLTDVLDPERHSLVYTGSLAPAGRTLEPLLRALRQVVSDSPGVLDRFELVVAGPLTEAEARMLDEVPPPAAVVRHLGMLGREEALGLQAAADSLLVVTSGKRTGEATGKLAEYLAAGKPILVLGDESEAARTVDRFGAGAAVPAGDPRTMAQVIPALVAGELPGYDAGAVSEAEAELSLARMAERMAAVIESVRPR